MNLLSSKLLEDKGIYTYTAFENEFGSLHMLARHYLTHPRWQCLFSNEQALISAM